jgi:hypothetical protein
MRDDDCAEDDEIELTGLDRRLRSLAPNSVPEDLLARCLSTICAPAQVRRPWWLRPGRWTSRLATAAAAVVLVAGLAILARPRPATAGHFLQTVRASWTEVPACHRVIVFKSSSLQRTTETWFVRGKGGRQETRSGDSLIGVVVNNGRWEFRWDVAEHLVAAWSGALMGKRSEFEHAGLIQNNEALLRWAETHQADIRIEPDTLEGLKVRKVVLRWPGPGGPGSHPQIDTVWFDPESLRPVRQRSDLWDGGVTEARYDYPLPENVPADLFAFHPPPELTLEINDPDLGRQVYSDARATRNDTTDQPSKGAER